MDWTRSEFGNALVHMQWIGYHYRYDKEINDACDLIYKRIKEDEKNGVRMVDDIKLPTQDEFIELVLQSYKLKEEGELDGMININNNIQEYVKMFD